MVGAVQEDVAAVQGRELPAVLVHAGYVPGHGEPAYSHKNNKNND